MTKKNCLILRKCRKLELMNSKLNLFKEKKLRIDSFGTLIWADFEVERSFLGTPTRVMPFSLVEYYVLLISFL
jgi:hypothetical protein